jgi:putative hydrolase of the HAD superfamily
MGIQAVVFDIGSVLEITPDLGMTEMWESRLGLGPGERQPALPPCVC